VLYRVKFPTGTGSLSIKSGNRGNSGNSPDFSGEFLGTAGNEVGTVVGTPSRRVFTFVEPVPTQVPTVFPVDFKKTPAKSTVVPAVPSVPTFLNRRELEQRAAVIQKTWQRIFGVDLEKRRESAKKSSIIDHLRTIESLPKPEPLADQLLEAIRLEKVSPAEIPSEDPSEILFTEQVEEIQKRKRQRLPHVESTAPGIQLNDIFRIFGRRSKVRLSRADWLEVPASDRLAIEAEASQWFRRGDCWRKQSPLPLKLKGELATCKRCSTLKTLADAPAWRRNGKIVSATYPDGKKAYQCSFCGKRWRPRRKKAQGKKGEHHES
jgi:hypothetical protein